jgi:hypothetical protein
MNDASKDDDVYYVNEAMPEESDDVEEHDTERITPRTVANNT